MLAFRRCLVSSSLKESGLTRRNAADILKDALAHPSEGWRAPDRKGLDAGVPFVGWATLAARLEMETARKLLIQEWRVRVVEGARLESDFGDAHQAAPTLLGTQSIQRFAALRCSSVSRRNRCCSSQFSRSPYTVSTQFLPGLVDSSRPKAASRGLTDDTSSDVTSMALARKNATTIALILEQYRRHPKPKRRL
jgi:hypothetical protein